MIISHQYKFIFIKTHKTAGTSIEIYLSQHCGDEDIITPIYPHVPPHRARNYKIYSFPHDDGLNETSCENNNHDPKMRRKFYNHVPALQVKNSIPKKAWNEYFKFCVERNPWDKTLSHYYWLKSEDKHRGRKISLSIDEYLCGGKYCINYPLYTDTAFNRIILDRVVKFESLTEELDRIFSMLGVPFEGSLNVWAKSKYRTDRRHYREIFTAEQGRIIERIFQREIQMHGYRY